MKQEEYLFSFQSPSRQFSQRNLVSTNTSHSLGETKFFPIHLYLFVLMEVVFFQGRGSRGIFQARGKLVDLCLLLLNGKNFHGMSKIQASKLHLWILA